MPRSISSVVTPLAATCLLAATTAHGGEETPRWGVGVGVGATTMGLGVEGIVRATDWLNLRVNAHSLKISPGIKIDTSKLVSDDEAEALENANELDEDAVDPFKKQLDLRLRNRNIGLMADVHPFGEGLKLSLGYYPKFRLEASGQETCETGCKVGNLTVTGDDVVYARSSDWNKGGVYGGLGFTNIFSGRSPLYFKFEFGAMAMQKPSVDALLSGGAAEIGKKDENGNTQTRTVANAENDPEVIAQAARDEGKLRDVAEDFKFYPIAGATIGLRFGWNGVGGKSVGGSAALPQATESRKLNQPLFGADSRPSYPSASTAPVSRVQPGAAAPAAARADSPSAVYLQPRTVTRQQQTVSPPSSSGLVIDQPLRPADTSQTIPPALLEGLPPDFRPTIFYAPDAP